MKILVTGGSGFIGSALVRYLIHQTKHEVLNLDKLTYAVDPKALETVETSERYTFIKGDICDGALVTRVIEEFQPEAIMHLAAESHVDRSIDSPLIFLQTNVIGTGQLLQSALHYWKKLPNEKKSMFRFLHVSTDEVYGDLPLDLPDLKFTEESPYKPSSPYSASKASADHLVRAWHRTYGLPTLITNCSNNFGQYQHEEKLIPLVIKKALNGEKIPIYGDGKQIRDWIHVDDHVEALICILEKGEIGETYNIGGDCEKANLEIVHLICAHLNSLNREKQFSEITDFKSLITSVKDRPGHDQKYSTDSTKLRENLNYVSPSCVTEKIRELIYNQLD